MKYIYTALLLMAGFVVSAQSIYRKASVVTNDGKTLTGYISIHNWGKNPKYIEFKNAPGDTAIRKFSPADINSFVVNGYAEYLTFKGRITVNHIRLRNLPDGKDTTSVIANIFLKQVATGDNVTLYSYTDNIKTRFFISEKQTPPHEMLYQLYYDELHNIHWVTGYSNELNTLFIKYTNGAENLTKIDTVRYNTDDLSNAVNYLNGNKNIKAPKPHTRFYAGAALTINNVSYLPPATLNNTPSAVKQVAYGPKITAGVDFMNNIDIQGFILRFELSADQYKAPLIIDQKNVSITIQALWNIYNSDAFKFYIGTGIGFNAEKTNNFTYNVPAQAGIVLNRRIEMYFSGTIRDPSYIGTAGGESLRSGIYNAGFHYLFGPR